MAIEFPKAAYDVPWSPPLGLKLDPAWRPEEKGPPAVWGPGDARNLARGRTVTASAEPTGGKLAMVTDGKKGAEAANLLTLPAGKQWVQVDLGVRSAISAVALWHRHDAPLAHHCVVVHASDDPTFARGVTVLFHNDGDDHLRLGRGFDHHYIETRFGKVIDTKGVEARYFRFYSKGNTADDENHYTEVEAWGVPAK